jgi:uncharacterized membrane protein YqjE
MMDAAHTRTTGELIKDGFDHIHEILRSEVALARAEIREETRTAAQGAVLGGAALTLAALGLSFLLWAAFWALANELPNWAAAAVVGLAALIVGGLVGMAAHKRFQSIQPPKWTERTMKENMEWVKNRAQ